MRDFFNKLVAFLASHFVAAASTSFALVGASVLSYFREQVRAGARWALTPLSNVLPWNKRAAARPPVSIYNNILIAEFSLVDVFLAGPDGRIAFYQKLTSFLADKDELSRYREGVSADGYVTDFATMRGTIVATQKEHGFYISEIDLGAVVWRGSRFTNVYTAKLCECFTRAEEHWTQEIAFPTLHLTIQIHFPETRPPKLVRCFVVDGTADREIATTASITELFGQRAIVWQLEKPRLKEVYKISWYW